MSAESAGPSPARVSNSISEVIGSRQAVALWNAILPDDFSDRPRLSRIYYAGKFYAYPLKAFEALRNLGLVQPKHK